MANRKSNFPNAQLKELDGSPDAAITLSQINALRAKATTRPGDAEELKWRIDTYFQYCASHELRPGIEGLCLCLGVSRQMFWRWCQGERGEIWSDICNAAKQGILAYIEALSLSGKLNPATSCFVLKNWGGYVDSMRFEAVQTTHTLSLEDIKNRLPDIVESDLSDSDDTVDIDDDVTLDVFLD